MNCICLKYDIFQFLTRTGQTVVYLEKNILHFLPNRQLFKIRLVKKNQKNVETRNFHIFVVPYYVYMRK